MRSDVVEPIRKDDYYKYAGLYADEDYEKVLAGFSQVQQGRVKEPEEVTARLGKKYFGEVLSV